MPATSTRSKPIQEKAKDAAVQKATGKTWDEWFRLLDKHGANKMPHKMIATLLSEKLGVGPWWCQMVTVGYEQARGMRKVNQTPRGFQISVSKTVAVPVGRLFDAFADAKLRKKWLGDQKMEIRKQTMPKSLRITWVDGTNVEVNLYERGDAKSSAQIQHDKLKTESTANAMKKFWKEKVERLAAVVEARAVTTSPSQSTGRGRHARHAMKTILFLCTGNYYRSRFAEMLFNHLAAVRGLAWRSESKGIATETNYLLPGVISPLTCAALAARGIPMPKVHRDAIQCSEADFTCYDRIIAVKDTEHRPMMRRRFPEFADEIDYWEINDLSHGPSESAITELDRRVRELIDELETRV